MTNLILDNSVWLLGALVLLNLCIDFYMKYIRVNKETDSFNITDKYVKLVAIRNKIKYNNKQSC